MSKLLLNREFSEHAYNVDISACEHDFINPILFKGKEDCVCVSIGKDDTTRTLSSSYYIGTDWLLKDKVAVFISPKFNNSSIKIDYLNMLFSCLRHPEIIHHTRELYEIKFDEPYIEIEQKSDILTPLLIVQYLQILKSIVRKGLKQSYYKVENNLHSKIKGKVLIAQTIKQNIFKNKHLNVVCSYDEFGLNSMENRLLKKALLFCQRYLSLFPDYLKFVSPVMTFCLPAFEMVSEKIDLNEIKTSKPNAFYKEYSEGIRIAKLILKRFGYNIKNTEKKETIQIPPFWVDMSKLFELYVLGLLKERYGNQVEYHFTKQYNELDFLLNTEQEKIVIDAKYKRKYQQHYDIDDIRQLSGYSRIKKVVEHLGYKSDEEQATAVIDCLIIYPDQNATLSLHDNLKKETIRQFVKFYKHGVRLPEII